MRALPGFKTQPTPQAVVDEHLDALNRGDWDRLMAQYPDDVKIFLPGGVVIRGREAVGDTINLQWRVDADFLREPYRGADAYVTRNGLMAAQVSTFDMGALNEKRKM